METIDFGAIPVGLQAIGSGPLLDVARPTEVFCGQVGGFERC